MISKANYKMYVTDRPLKKGDLIAHDSCEPYYVFDGKDFLQIWRNGNNGGKLTISDNHSSNLDFPEASFYRFSYMGNIAEGIHIETTEWKSKDGKPWSNYNDAELKRIQKELIPGTLGELAA